MHEKILVTYASISGSTAEVAEAIALELNRNGCDADVKAASTIDSVDDYHAVVLGSSVREGRWLSDSLAFLDTFRDALVDRPVAYFTTCLTMVHDTEANRRAVLAYMEPIRSRAPELTVVGLGLFAGSVDPYHRSQIKVLQGPRTDYRDWDAIDAWAREVAPRLRGRIKRSAASKDESVILTGALLSKADMSGMRLVSAEATTPDLTLEQLADADLSGADLRHVRLHWAALKSANMAGANISDVNLVGANLIEANLTKVNAQRAMLNGAQLRGAKCAGADFREADMNWADLSGSDLRNCDLRLTNLAWASLEDAELSGANLDGALYNEATRWPKGFSPSAAGCIFVTDTSES